MTRDRYLRIMLLSVVFILLTCSGYAKPVFVEVYLDADGNGIRDVGENGMAGVCVTNGVDVVPTAGDGTLILDVIEETYRFVTITSPSGCKPTTPWYHKVDFATVESDTAVFGLASDPRRSGDAFTWVHITDTQITSTLSYPLSADLEEIEELAVEPLFIVNTGDIVNDGNSLAQWEYYVGEISTTTVPMYHVVGNHDDTENPNTLDNYEHYVGPPYYSFEIGDYHFVAYNIWFSSIYTPMQETWLVNDVAQASSSGTKILFEHFTFRRSPQPIKDLLLSVGISSVFSGHHHSTNLSVTPEGVGDYTLVYTRGGGRDWTARLFNLVSCEPDGSMTFDLRRLSVDHRAVITSPSSEGLVKGDPLIALVQAYDTATTAQSMMATVLDSTGATIAAGPMTKQGISLWRAEFATEHWPAGSYAMQVVGSFTDGHPVLLDKQFPITEGSLVQGVALDDWPMFRANTEGTAATTRPLTPPLKLAWTYPLPGMVAHNSPVVADGRVYIGVRTETTPATAGLFAFSANDGQVLWNRHLNGGMALAPGVFENVVVANALNDSIHGFDAVSGNPLWSMEARDAHFNQAAPIGTAGQVFVGGKPYGYLIEPETGAVSWESDYIGPTWFENIYSSPVMTSDRIYLNTYGGPGVEGGLSILDRTSGTHVVPQIYGAYRPPVQIDEQLLVVGNASYSDQVLTGRGSNGEVLWTSVAEIRRGMGAPGSADGVVVFAARDGAIKGADVVTGEELWSHPVGPGLYDMFHGRIGDSMTLAAPAIADGVVYIGSIDGHLYALDLQLGTELWSWNIGAPVASTAAISGNMLFVGAGDGNLYAFVGDSDFVAPVLPGGQAGSAGLRFRIGARRADARDVCLHWHQDREFEIKIDIYDIRGRLVREVVDTVFDAGANSATWDGRDNRNGRAAAGVYIARIRGTNIVESSKFVLVR